MQLIEKCFLNENRRSGGDGTRVNRTAMHHLKVKMNGAVDQKIELENKRSSVALHSVMQTNFSFIIIIFIMIIRRVKRRNRHVMSRQKRFFPLYSTLLSSVTPDYPNEPVAHAWGSFLMAGNSAMTIRAVCESCQLVGPVVLCLLHSPLSLVSDDMLRKRQ